MIRLQKEKKKVQTHLDKLSYWVFGSILLSFAIQLLLIVFFWNKPQGSDPGAYVTLATRCVSENSWYPSTQDIYSSYIWAPGFINFLILQIKCFGTTAFNTVINLLMHGIITYEIWLLGKKFFSQRSASFAVIFYCLTYSNWFVIIPAGTEVPFLCLSLTAWCFCIKDDWRYLLLGGALFALANTIRPLVVIFMLTIVIYLIIKRRKPIFFLALLIPFLLISYGIGKNSELRMGYFVYKSSTAGVNLVMSANDKAYGGVATSLLSDTTTQCYIENKEQYTFLEKDAIWKERSFEWIKQHPARYIKLYLLKIGGLFIEDSWADRPILGGDGFIDKYANNQATTRDFILRAVSMFLKSIVYYIISLLFLYSLWIHRRSLFTDKSYLLLIGVFGVGMTCLFAVTPRYHYPFYFIMTLFAASAVDSYLQRKKR